MSTLSRALLLSIFLTIGLSTLAQPTIINFDFGAVLIDCAGYAYEWPSGRCGTIYPTQDFNGTPAFGWTLSKAAAQFRGLSGLTGPDSAFSPPSFEGLPFSQAVFLQGAGAYVKQAIPGFAAGSYVLTFYLGSRYTSPPFDGNQTVQVSIDGQVIGTWSLQTATPFTQQIATFTTNTSGTHTLQFLGTKLGDHTAFLSYVVITPTVRM